jgi:hypothetical protein
MIAAATGCFSFCNIVDETIFIEFQAAANF